VQWIKDQPNLGVVCRIAYSYWQKLPPAARAFMDLDDMISDVVTHLAAVANRYDGTCSPSTFVWVVASNYCKGVLSYYASSKRRAVVVPPEHARHIGCHGGLPRVELALMARKLLAMASPELRRELVRFSRNRRYRPLSPGLMDELRQLVRAIGANFDEFRTILRVVAYGSQA
jgi:hypothetical protein